MELLNEIIDLVKLRQEGGYWDFKREWHKNNTELLFDIICMANNLEDRDAYIIIGVDEEEKEYSFVDVLNDENRKNTQQIVDFLSAKKFVSGKPTVYVETLIIEDYNVDVIVIKNSTNTPYYLTDREQGIYAYQIYTRDMDTNTPKTKNAQIHQVEQLWKKRFGIDKTISERACILLEDVDNWEYKGNLPSYHQTFPEFTITFSEDDYDLTKDRLSGYYINKCSRGEYCYINYHTTKVSEIYFIYLDEYRVAMPYPEQKIYEIDENKLCYWYFNKDSMKGKLFLLLNKIIHQEDKHIKITGNYFKTNYKLPLEDTYFLFDNDKERLEFEDYIKQNINEYKNITQYKSRDIMEFRSVVYEHEVGIGTFCLTESMYKLKEMYNKWITERGDY